MADPVLSVRGLSRRFGALVAVDGVDLDLRAGEIHALIGPNGAGKSTLIRLIAGEMRADAGQVVFAGRNLAPLDAPARARAGLARTFQVSQVAAEFTALQNVALAVAGALGSPFRFFRPALSDPALTGPARRALLRAGLAGREGLRAADLSHGERRRLEVAIALALAPRAFLMDEPMAGLGADGTADLTALLAALKAEAPILLVEHDMDAVFALADRVSVLVYGRIIATGPVAQVLDDPEERRA